MAAITAYKVVRAVRVEGNQPKDEDRTWEQVGEPYTNRGNADGAKGAAVANNVRDHENSGKTVTAKNGKTTKTFPNVPLYDFKVVEIEPVQFVDLRNTPQARFRKRQAEVQANKARAGEISSELWLQGEKVEVIDAQFRDPFDPSAKRPPPFRPHSGSKPAPRPFTPRTEVSTMIPGSFEGERPTDLSFVPTDEKALQGVLTDMEPVDESPASHVA